MPCVRDNETNVSIWNHTLALRFLLPRPTDMLRRDLRLTSAAVRLQERHLTNFPTSFADNWLPQMTFLFSFMVQVTVVGFGRVTRCGPDATSPTPSLYQPIDRNDLNKTRSNDHIISPATTWSQVARYMTSWQLTTDGIGRCLNHVWEIKTRVRKRWDWEYR